MSRSRPDEAPSKTPARLWADLCRATPSVTSARALSADGRIITSKWSQRDVVRGKKQRFSLNFVRGHSPEEGNVSYCAMPPSEDPPNSVEFTSPSGKRLVRFSRNSGAGVTEVEVWSFNSRDAEGRWLDAIWTIEDKVHRAVFSDEWFGGVAWAPEENMFIYVADRPVSGNTSSAASTSKEKGKNGPADADSWIDGLRGKYAETSRDVLGEAYINQRSPALFLADVKRAQSKPMCPPGKDALNDDDGEEDEDEDDANSLFGDPQWSPDGKWIAVTRRPLALTEPSLEEDGIMDKLYDLGVRYCYNRYSAVEIFEAPNCLDDAASSLRSLVPLSHHFDHDDFCCSSPRFSPNSRLLVYLSTPRKDHGLAKSTVLPHNSARVLRGVSLGDEPGATSTVPVTIVDVVRCPTPSAFPGLYVHALPQRPWLETSCGDKRSLTIVTSSIWGSAERVVQVPVSIGQDFDSLIEPTEAKIVDITPKCPRLGSSLSTSVLDVCEGGLVLCVSSPVLSPQIAFFATNSDGSVRDIATPVSSSAQTILQSGAIPTISTVDLVLSTEEEEAQVDSSLAAVPYESGKHSNDIRFQVTLIVPASEKSQVPLVVYPHGGPHSCSVNGFSQGVAAMVLSGIAVLYVNFRGSIGLGENSLQSLPGRAGTQDVAEVLQATKWGLQASPYSNRLDEKRVGYVGGSHGGFLGAHCSVVPGTPFKLTALRNPVINVSSMVNVTDIPEWAFCEAGVDVISSKTGLALSADPSALERMWSASPVSRVSKGGTPPGRTVLFVGGGDRRVPPEQSIEWQRLISEAYGPGIVTLRWYPEAGHAIDDVPDGDDVWVHTLELFETL